MAEGGVRIGVLGATGALGSEVLAALDASSIRVSGIVPVASERSLGEDIEFQGEVYPVETSWPRLETLDLVFCCAPAEASLEVAQGFAIAWQNDDFETAYDYFIPGLQEIRSKTDFKRYATSFKENADFDFIYDKVVLQDKQTAYA